MHDPAASNGIVPLGQGWPGQYQEPVGSRGNVADAKIAAFRVLAQFEAENGEPGIRTPEHIGLDDPQNEPPAARRRRPEADRYIDFQRSLGGGAAAVSARLLSQEPERDAAGRIVRLRTARPSFTPREIARLFQPYVSQRFLDQFKTVAPLAAYLVLFQLLVLRQLVQDSWLITGGLLAVILGLMFFMEGLKLGLMPFGTVIGATLPRKSSLPVVLIITLLLGIGVTFAEPAISALKMAGQNVAVERAPYLYALLNDWAGTLVLVVGASVMFLDKARARDSMPALKSRPAAYPLTPARSAAKRVTMPVCRQRPEPEHLN